MGTRIPRFDLTPLQECLIQNLSPTAFQLSVASQEVLGTKSGAYSRVHRRLDFLFHDFKSKHSDITDGLEAISVLNDYLFDDQEFKIFSDDSCTIKKFFFGSLLENRVGSALSFSILYRELAGRLGLVPVNHVNFPGLSLIKIFYNHQLLFIDPAEEGRLLTVSDLQGKLFSRYGKNVVLSGSFLETPTENHVVNRLLTKLKNIYFDLRLWEYLLGTLDLLVWLNPTKLHELKERGLLLYQLGYHQDAKIDLATFVSQARPSIETDKLRRLVNHLENPNVRPLYD
jgi:regulator of sirC expression with transglutaminase-like and TPR domain